MKEELLELGFCTKPHGIKGGFTFSLYNDENSVLQVGSRITLFPRSDKSVVSPKGQVYIISQLSFGNKVIAYFEGISDRTRCEEIIPFDIFINRDELPALDDNEFYVKDLIGLDVFEAGTDKLVGKITDFYENGAQIVYRISTGGRVLELPFVEAFFPVVDIGEGRIEINLPEVIDG